MNKMVERVELEYWIKNKAASKRIVSGNYYSPYYNGAGEYIFEIDKDVSIQLLEGFLNIYFTKDVGCPDHSFLHPLSTTFGQTLLHCPVDLKQFHQFLAQNRMQKINWVPQNDPNYFGGIAKIEKE